MNPANTAAPALRFALRDMDASDAGAVEAVEATSSPSPLTFRRIRRLLVHGEARGVVATVRGVVVAHVLYRPTICSLWLHRLAVDPGFRRQDIGSHLMAAVKSRLTGPRRVIDAQVRDDNLPAHLFLRSNGFRCVATTEADDDHGLYLFEYRAVPPGASIQCGDQVP